MEKIRYVLPLVLCSMYDLNSTFNIAAFLFCHAYVGFQNLTDMSQFNYCYFPLSLKLIYARIENCSRIQVLILSVAAYVASFLGITLMFIWYVPKLSCKLNIFFITLTLVLVQIMTLVSVHSKVKAGFLTPGLMGMYIVFICWCAIRSEPQRDICNKKAQAVTHEDWLTIISFVIAILAIVMATFLTGGDSSFQFKKTEAKADDVPYGYGFFHFVFAMGAMYFAMLFISWNMHHTMQKWTIDVGWASTWVRIVNEWAAAVVYVWMLVAPSAWGHRRFVT